MPPPPPPPPPPGGMGGPPPPPPPGNLPSRPSKGQVKDRVSVNEATGLFLTPGSTAQYLVADTRLLARARFFQISIRAPV